MERKIKHIHDLRLQQQLLLQKQELLEKSIKEDWSKLRESLRPGNIVTGFFSNWAHGKKNGADGNNLLSTGLSFLVKKALTKVEKMFT